MTARARLGDVEQLDVNIQGQTPSMAEIDTRTIELEEPLRHLGEFQVPVRISADLRPAVTVRIESE